VNGRNKLTEKNVVCGKLVVKKCGEQNPPQRRKDTKEA
jgi:hypothetical protein